MTENTAVSVVAPPPRRKGMTALVVTATIIVTGAAILLAQYFGTAYRDSQNIDSIVACEKLGGEPTGRYNCILSDGLIVEPIQYLSEYGEIGGEIRRDTTNLKEAEDE